VWVGIATNGFSYDAADSLTKLADGKNQTATWKYDQYRRVTNKVDAATTSVFAYQYDAANRVTNRIDAVNRSTKYAYDAVGNVTTVIYPGFTNRFAYTALDKCSDDCFVVLGGHNRARTPPNDPERSRQPERRSGEDPLLSGLAPMIHSRAFDAQASSAFL
jgi:YD repeat-containing protein